MDSAAAKYGIGIAIIIAGVVVAVGFADAKFLIFTGRPLGIVLVAVGAWELFDAWRGQKKVGQGPAERE